MSSYRGTALIWGANDDHYTGPTPVTRVFNKRSAAEKFAESGDAPGHVERVAKKRNQ